VLSSPPYNFQPNSVGLTYLSPFIANMPATILGGHLADRVTVWQVRKHGGVSEAAQALLALTYAVESFHCMKPDSRDGPQAEVQECAPYLISFVALCMILPSGFVSQTICDSANRPSRTTPSPHGYSTRALRTNFGISSTRIIFAIMLMYVPILRWGKCLRKTNAAYYMKFINW
jgi:hypothetical protein